MFIHIDLWLIGILLSVACYLVNYHMMRFGVGIYNTDPNHKWQGEFGAWKRGPDVDGRAWLFVFSPFVVFVIFPIMLVKLVKKAVAAAIASAVLFASTIPTEKVAEAVFVKDVGTLQWVEVQGTGAYTGYRSPEVGRPEFGSTVSARAYELDLVGGLAPKTA